MSSIVEGYNYDIFISYRQKDNKGDRWVSEFVEALKTELESTFKEEISVYFDINPHDGLLETHDVDASLKDKLKCLVFIPIISRTYCDPMSFAWEHEFKAFVEQASKDQFGLKVKLPNGNVASRVLSIRIHDLDNEDVKCFEGVTGGLMRTLDFIFKTSSGVNRPLKSREDHPGDNLNKTYYQDQINKVALAIKEIIRGLKGELLENAGEPKEFVSVIEKSAPPEKSIIVLPFENISPDPDQEYFSDGLTEEIITDLSHILGLLVISRNSAMTFKGTKKKTKEIAGDVNVRYVLEGSVRKAGNNLRITAQLIDASNDSHIWAEKYNGTLDDIFDIQEKVSLSIADSLKIELGKDTQQQIAYQVISDSYIYELYLKVRYENWQFNELSFKKSEELLKQGLKLAGDNELLYSEMSLVNVQYVNNLLKDPDEYPELLAKADHYAEQALMVNPNSASAFWAKGCTLFQSCHPVEAIDILRKAIRLEPNSSESALWYILGYLYSATGCDLEEAEKLIEKAKTIDPLTLIIKAGQGWRLFFLGKFQESVNEFAEWQHFLEQGNTPIIILNAWNNGLNRNFKEAFRIIDNLVLANPTHIFSSLGLFMKYSWMKEKQKALDIVSETLEKAAWWDDIYPLIMAEGYAVIEEYDKAFRWLNRAIDYGITNIPFLSEYDPFLENLRSDKRFKASLNRAKEILDSIKGLKHV